MLALSLSLSLRGLLLTVAPENPKLAALATGTALSSRHDFISAK